MIDMDTPSHLSLFSGIGGLDIAAEWAGFHTVGQCEWADYPTQVLEKQWPEVPHWRDIRTLTKEGFYERTGLHTVELISGGFPCQPFSVAGKRRGREDDRYLWPEMLRVIRELKPTWVVGENVAGIVNMALDQVLSDLETSGYTCQAFVIPACAVDAPHRRNRCAIVAYADNGGRAVRRHGKFSTVESHGIGGNNYLGGAQEYGRGEWRAAQPRLGRVADGVSRWLDEPVDVPRVAYRVPNRVGRLKCLGNAVVPQQFYPIFRAIWEVDYGSVET